MMKGTVKDLLKTPGVQGYAIVSRGKTIQLKLPGRHKLAGAKDNLLRLAQEVFAEQNRPGNIVEIYIEDIVLTLFVSNSTILMVMASSRTNQALLRMTGKLVLASLDKEKGR